MNKSRGKFKEGSTVHKIGKIVNLALITFYDLLNGIFFFSAPGEFSKKSSWNIGLNFLLSSNYLNVNEQITY